MSRREPPPPLPRLEELLGAMAGLGGAVVDALPGGQLVKSAAARALNPVALPPANALATQQYEHYQRMLAARGFTVDPVNPTVVALRGLSSKGTVHDTTSAAKYDDTIVVLKRDAKGNPEVTTLPGSTHPGQKRAAEGGTTGVPDVSVPRDGKADVGMIQSGEYRLVARDGGYAGAAAWDLRTAEGSGTLPGVRDTNQDGKFSPAEREASQSRRDTLKDVLIHQGGANVPWSVGCINLSGENSTVYPQFVGAVGSAREAKLVILDANRS